MPTTRNVPPRVQRLRARMDRLNERLVTLLQARARLAGAIGAAKAKAALPAADPARERAMLARMLASAPPGLPRRDLERVLKAVLAASRRLVVAQRRARS
jgi:chorismate mutase